MKLKKPTIFLITTLLFSGMLFNTCVQSIETDTDRISALTETITREMYNGVCIFSETAAKLRKIADNAVNSSLENPDTIGFENKLNSLMPTETNYMFSPLSIKMALSLAANGSTGETQKEILELLGKNSIDTLNKDMSSLILSYSETSDFDFNLANGVFLNSDSISSELSPEYEEKIKENFNADTQTVTNENAVNTVNSWVKTRTNNKISDITDNPYFSLILANAVYFKASWKNEFSPALTKKDIFTDRNNNKITTDFMHNSGKYRYYKDETIEIAELPYLCSGINISMYIALSDDKRIDFNSYTEKMTNRQGSISIPKFKLEFSKSLTDTLKSLGLIGMFDELNSELTEILKENTQKLYVTDILHKTFIEVDEKGTEAAASTSLMLTTTALETEPPFEFTANKPFTYFIKDNTNNEILFMGEYAFVE